MIGLDDKLGGDHRLLGSGPHQARIGPPPERQPERIQENRFARPGLPSEHAQPRPEGKAQPVDQNDVANGQAEQHAGKYTINPRPRLPPPNRSDVADRTPQARQVGRALFI